MVELILNTLYYADPISFGYYPLHQYNDSLPWHSAVHRVYIYFHLFTFSVLANYTTEGRSPAFGPMGPSYKKMEPISRLC
jgi:hypothetical protein